MRKMYSENQVGNKFYIHDINLTNENGAVDITIVFVSSIKKKVSSFEELKDALNKSIEIKTFTNNDSGTYLFAVIPNTSGESISFNGIDNSGAVAFLEYRNLEGNIYTDLVSEL